MKLLRVINKRIKDIDLNREDIKTKSCNVGFRIIVDLIFYSIKLNPTLKVSDKI